METQKCFTEFSLDPLPQCSCVRHAKNPKCTLKVNSSLCHKPCATRWIEAIRTVHSRQDPRENRVQRCLLKSITSSISWNLVQSVWRRCFKTCQGKLSGNAIDISASCKVTESCFQMKPPALKRHDYLDTEKGGINTKLCSQIHSENISCVAVFMVNFQWFTRVHRSYTKCFSEL